MAEPTANEAKIVILSIYRDLAEAYVETLAGEGATEVIMDGITIRFNIMAGDPIQYPSWDSEIAAADFIIIVVRFLDVYSLEKIKAIYRFLPTNTAAPAGIFLLRDKGEIDFKISCPACGQKLWLRDTDVGKRGRCPNCKKPFLIQSQMDYLKTQLMLPDNVLIKYVVREDVESCGGALKALMETAASGIKPLEAAAPMDAAKNVTMRIQINE